MAGMRRPVAVIIGMMGAGKTRVGKEAAQMMQLPFADADNEIEHDAGMKIPNISKGTANRSSVSWKATLCLTCWRISTASSPWAGALQ